MADRPPPEPVEAIQERLARRLAELRAERERRPPAPDRLAEITAEVDALAERFDGMTDALASVYRHAGEAVPAAVTRPRHLRLVRPEDGAA